MRRRHTFFYFILLSGLLAALVMAVNRSREKSSLSGSGSSAGRVALIDITGVIASSSDIPGEAVGARSIVEQIDEYGEDGSVRALVLRINSPGGTVVAAQEIYNALLRFREETGKPVVASMADVAASGGYYIACGADRIYANAGSITGSIGVIMQFPNFTELFSKIGVDHATIKSGPLKDTGNPFRKMSDVERQALQTLVDNVYDQFVEAVAIGRNLDVAEVRTSADGRIFSGSQALELGLVDEIGDLDSAVREAAVRAGIEGKPEILEKKRRPRIWELLEGRLAGLFPLAGRSSTARILYLWN
jgi:protease-4